MAVDFDAVWTGAVSSLWELAGNWSPANIPTAAEDIFVPAGTPAIDATGMVDTQFGVLHIARGHTGDIGAVGTMLNGGFTEIRHNGSGHLYYQQVAQTTSRIVIDAPGQVAAATIDGTISVGVFVFRGIVTISGSAGVLPFLECAYRSDPGGDARVVLAPGANAVTFINQNGGVVTSNGRAIGAIDQCGGECIMHIGQAITTATVRGKLDYRSNTTLANLTVVGGGTVDFTQGRTNDVTVTNSYFHPQSTILFDKNLVNFPAATNWDWR